MKFAIYCFAVILFVSLLACDSNQQSAAEKNQQQPTPSEANKPDRPIWEIKGHEQELAFLDGDLVLGVPKSYKQLASKPLRGGGMVYSYGPNGGKRLILTVNATNKPLQDNGLEALMEKIKADYQNSEAVKSSRSRIKTINDHRWVYSKLKVQQKSQIANIHEYVTAHDGKMVLIQHLGQYGSESKLSADHASLARTLRFVDDAQ